MANDPEQPGIPPADSDKAAEERRKRQDALLDQALKDTFPASDPVSLAQDRRP